MTEIWSSIFVPTKAKWVAQNTLICLAQALLQYIEISILSLNSQNSTDNNIKQKDTICHFLLQLTYMAMKD